MGLCKRVKIVIFRDLSRGNGACGSKGGWVEATDDWTDSGQMDTFCGILYAG